jgi:hypothetical protein
MQSIHEQKKSPVVKTMTLIDGGLAVILVFTLTPWNSIPTKVTEGVTVLAITEKGCVGDQN